ncbi:MAG TPA: hypothetical protein VEI07_14515 [Planctomycetaceae bacterium]|nr:hypothetical protein [Planctomycetaceae bacterium]
MSGSANLGILQQPLQPLGFWKCPKCGRWFAFKKVLEEKSEISGVVSTYRCEHCGHEQKFAERHPPHAI